MNSTAAGYEYVVGHMLDPDEVGVKSGDLTDWKRRHREALAHPTTTERHPIRLARMIQSYAVHYGDDGYGVPNVIAPMIAAFRASLNFDLGRLDAGTLERFAWSVAERIGWDLDADDWA